MELGMHHVHDPSRLLRQILKMFIFIIPCVDVNLIQFSVTNSIKNLLNEAKNDSNLIIREFN